MEEGLFNKTFKDLSEEGKPIFFIDDNNSISDEDHIEKAKLLLDDEDCKFDQAVGGKIDEVLDECQKAVDSANELRRMDHTIPLFDMTFDETIEENIEKLMEETESLIRANTLIEMDNPDEFSEIEISDREEDKPDEAEAEAFDMKSQDSEKTVYSFQLDLTKATERRSQVKWGSIQSFVIHNNIPHRIDNGQEKLLPEKDEKDVHQRPWVGILKNKTGMDGKGEESGIVELHRNMDDEDDDLNMNCGGAKGRPSRLSLFLREMEERLKERTEDSSEGNDKKIVRRNQSRKDSTFFYSMDEADEIKRIESSDDEDSKFDEAVGGEVDKRHFGQNSARKAEVNRSHRPQVSWSSNKSLTPNHVGHNSKQKTKSQSLSDMKKKNNQKKGKKKKSGFSCFYSCCIPKYMYDGDDDPDDMDNLTSVPRASIRGLIGTEYL